MKESVEKRKNITNTSEFAESDEVLEIEVSFESELQDKPSFLILWNDDINNEIDVIMALCVCCKLDTEMSQHIVSRAHRFGKSVAQKGTFNEMMKMKNALEHCNIRAIVYTRGLGSY